MEIAQLQHGSGSDVKLLHVAFLLTTPTIGKVRWCPSAPAAAGNRTPYGVEMCTFVPKGLKHEYFSMTSLCSLCRLKVLVYHLASCAMVAFRTSVRAAAGASIKEEAVSVPQQCQHRITCNQGLDHGFKGLRVSHNAGASKVCSGHGKGQF